MPKKFSLLLLFVFTAYLGFSQSSISGIIKDTSSNKFVKNAVVALISQPDSILIKFTRTSEDGYYILKNLPNGKHTLMVTHPAFADYVEDIYVKAGTENFPLVAVTPKSKLLEAVIIKSGSPIRIKGDTTIYTADSFKVSANANVEELLKRMPGIQVDKNGQIKAMGETVEKVLVDGEEFFGDDPGMAVKNLRADAVKEVQVFKRQSDQAAFTGIDDGQSKQTINLKLKEDKKKGYFGKIDAAGGLQKSIDDRYNTNILFSTFKGKRKLSAFLLNGNTGQDGLNWQDREKFSDNSDFNMSMDEDGGIMLMSVGGSSDEEPYINTENGFMTNLNAGLSYSNKFKDANTLSFSPKFNSQLYNNSMNSFTQTQVGDSIFRENSSTNTYINRQNIKLNAAYDLKIDSNNSIKFTVAASAYQTESEERRSAATTGEMGNLKNSTDRDLSINSEKQSLNASVLFKHKFKKLRRTLSINSDFYVLNSDANNILKSKNQTYNDGNPSFLQDINQLRDIERATQRLSTTLLYTEPLSEKYAMELGYELSRNSGTNNQTTFGYSTVTGKYETMVDSLTNDFDQTITTHKPTFKINYASKKIKFNFGSGFGITDFDFVDKTIQQKYVRNFTNFFPQAFLSYTYKGNRNLRFNYNGNTKQPSLSQLQPIANNNDLFNQYIGNPDLKQSFSNSFNLSHNSYDFIKDRWMYQSVRFSTTSNAITNNRIIDLDSGKTTIQPINTDGNYNMNFYSGIGMKIKKLDIRIDAGPNFNYSRFADVINSINSFATNVSAGMSLGLSKSKEKKYDIWIQNEFNFSSNKSTVSGSSSFYTNTINANVRLYYKKVWSINTEYNFFSRPATKQFDQSLNNHLWNARLERTFKKDEFTAYMMIRDILNQNIGIDRRFYSNTVSEIRNDRLQRYWMVGFTWNFKNKSAAPAPAVTN